MTDFMDVKTQELSREALNWAVGKADGQTVYVEDPQYGTPSRVMAHGKRPGCFLAQHRRFNPAEDWTVAGPLIEKHMLSLHCPQYSTDCWAAWKTVNRQDFAKGGETPLIAACRAIVASVLGDTVSVPKELV